MHAVLFEIGYVCCLYGDIIKQKLKFLYEEDYDFSNETSSYIEDMLLDVQNVKFNDLDLKKRSTIRIHRMISNL